MTLDLSAKLDIERAIEALLFAAAAPLSAADLARRLPEGADVGKALAALKSRYADRGVTLEVVADKWQFRTAPDLSHLMVEEREEPRRLSKAALETLAIIAYHQPVTRAEIETVRGVGLSRGTLDVLHEMNLIRLRGRRRSPGRPVTYGTTEHFLEVFSLPSLHDLPGAAEMRAAGLLDLNVPADFVIPEPGGAREAEDPIGLEELEQVEFAQDFFEGADSDRD
ncbi:SMC-Scp complex subunit ScpB [Asticcacaulis excentricus]|uniref:Chromosome segregation and condensation protein, ScpB n=1 Tax=Asticcacaulis excentricus (strain ATCC 15261 / DSM 4724 / KCTC 12464 / NCIMB 9791 / VKM B-1370 / CB 48) TaxID=573065 RepID=E8RP53_ASTEC|nr:SMC-Scp complex subunit ScpB [Asticcacaulis excentricus]ADU13023.1 chromosome segregation and condensation protein, ScpB [Asticcacaulis excentricus CB 48]